MDRSAKLQSATCSAAPDISKETPAWAKDCDYGMFATSEPAPTPNGSPPVWGPQTLHGHVLYGMHLFQLQLQRLASSPGLSEAKMQSDSASNSLK